MKPNHANAIFNGILYNFPFNKIELGNEYGRWRKLSSILEISENVRLRLE